MEKTLRRIIFCLKNFVNNSWVMTQNILRKKKWKTQMKLSNIQSVHLNNIGPIVGLGKTQMEKIKPSHVPHSTCAPKISVFQR